MGKRRLGACKDGPPLLQRAHLLLERIGAAKPDSPNTSVKSLPDLPKRCRGISALLQQAPKSSHRGRVVLGEIGHDSAALVCLRAWAQPASAISRIDVSSS